MLFSNRFLALVVAASALMLTNCADKKEFKASPRTATAAKNAEVKKPEPAPAPEPETIQEEATAPKNETIQEVTKEQEILKALPKFGLLVNNFECGFCHMKLIGDMASSETVPAARNDSIATIEGNWLVRGKLNVNKAGAQVTIKGQTMEDYMGSEIPASVPKIDMAKALEKAKGKLAAENNVAIDKVHKGNLFISGSEATPIFISGDVVVDGDLVIKGNYSGVGTIYVTGSVYIPSDLKASKSIFPYPDDRASALNKAEASATMKDKDGLGLAAAKFVFLGSVRELENAGFDKGDPGRERLAYKEMYKWFGEKAYTDLFSVDNSCNPAVKRTGIATFNVIDAFLYAGKNIEGIIRNSSFSIRGGIVSENFNIVNGGNVCNNPSIGNNAVHGRKMDNSYIEYDWRLGTGKFPILERLGEALIIK